MNTLHGFTTQGQDENEQELQKYTTRILIYDAQLK